MADEAGKREGGEDESLPEVEAELVSETPSSEGAFDADAPKAAPQGELGADEKAPESQSGAESGPEPESGRKPPLTSSFTPGVLVFLTFAVVALVAFAVWRFSPLGAPPKTSPETSPDAQTSSAAAPETAQEQTEASPQAVPEATPESVSGSATPPAPAEIKDADVKIANTLAANTSAGELKTAPDGVASEGEAGFLPPVTEAGAAKIANVVEDGVKEAMRSDQDDDAEMQRPAIENDPSTAETIEAEAAPEIISNDAADLQADEVLQAVEAPLSEENADDAADVLRFENEIARLQASFAEQKENLEAALNDEKRINADLTSEVERLRAALAGAETARNEAANDEVLALRAEVEKLRREQANISARQMRSSFALAALARAIDQGDPFSQELSAVAEFAPDASAALGAYAKTGVATDAELRTGFGAAARAALAAARREKAGGGVAGLVARAQGLVSVRPAAPVDGDAPGAVLSRAEHALDEGEVAFALSQLKDLPIVAQDAMADWMAEARARAEAQAALARLETEISGDAG